jgi:DNA-binding transcriptional LysR family regulator
VEVLCDEPIIVVAGARNPWSRRHRIELADLLNEPWTLPSPDSLFGSVVVEAFRARGLDFPRTMVIANAGAVRIALVATGRFLTIVPNSMLVSASITRRSSACLSICRQRADRLEFSR